MADEDIKLNGVYQVGLTPAGYTPGMAIPANMAFSTAVLPNETQSAVAAGAILTGAAGVLAIQRFVDFAGQIPQGSAVTVALAAGVGASVTIGDGSPFLSYVVTVTPNGGAAATLTLLAITLRAAEVVGGTTGSPFAVSGTVSLSGGTVVGVSGSVSLGGGTVDTVTNITNVASATLANAQGTASNPLIERDINAGLDNGQTFVQDSNTWGRLDLMLAHLRVVIDLLQVLVNEREDADGRIADALNRISPNAHSLL